MTDPAPNHRPTLEYRSPAEPRPARRPPHASIRTLATLLAIAAFAVLAAYLAWIRPHQHRVRQADAHAQALNATLAKDPRFANVVILNGSDGGGVLKVHGYVRDPSDLAALRQLVIASRSPVPVEWWTNVHATPAARPTTTQLSP